ncbi:MAG: MFS transporter [Kiritimatiellia bacterium]
MWSRPRFAVCAYFAILGLVCSAWTSSIDDLKALLDLSDECLGLLLMAGPVGNLASFFFASDLINRLGSRRAVRLVSPLYLTAASLLALCFVFKAPLAFWCLGLALFGATGNLLNIGINTQAGIVERACGRNIMSSFHASFSLFVLAGGLMAFLCTLASVPVHYRIFAVLGLAVLMHLLASGSLPHESKGACAAAVRGGFRRPDRSLLLLGLAAIVIMGCEGAVNEWVNVFYHKSLTPDFEHFRKVGFCAFAIAMFFGRAVGNSLLDRFSTTGVFRFYIAVTGLGLGLSLLSPFAGRSASGFLVTATLGFTLAGFGISGLVPILYSRANRTKAMSPASALTFVGSMGFLGYFFGPPLIGLLSQRTNLSIALAPFAILIVACLFLRLGEDEKSA